jgi:anthranilate synthase component I
MPKIFQKVLVADGLTPVVAFSTLRGRYEGGAFLLESVEGGERWARYSIVGYRPKKRIVLYGEAGVDPFARLAELAPSGGEDVADPAARFATAHVGLVAYEIVHFATKVERWPAEVEGPIARILSECTVLVFDHLKQTLTIAGTDESHVEACALELKEARVLEALPAPSPSSRPQDVSVNLSDEAYSRVVEVCREHIKAGDAFQIVPARTFRVPMQGTDPFDVYRYLRVLSPAPYMYFLELPAEQGAPSLAIAGASPETLVRVENRRVYLRPIAGTRRRGKTAEEDEFFAQEMMSDPKEIAEHVMLIDLARNDIGRIAASGTVRVPERLFVERYSHVMHITSVVEGEVDEGQGPWDVLRATFPAGTLSGAPKVRAMQIIREVELRPRFSYGGAIGYVTRGRELDFAIGIRTVLARDEYFEVTAGAGIVADSEARLECKETWNKASAALSAIEAAREHQRHRS